MRQNRVLLFLTFKKFSAYPNGPITANAYEDDSQN